MVVASLACFFSAIESNKACKSFESSVEPSPSRTCCISEGLAAATGADLGAGAELTTPPAMLSNNASSSFESPDVLASPISSTHLVKNLLQLLGQRRGGKGLDDVAASTGLSGSNDIFLFGFSCNHHHRQMLQGR